jgi:hypothetical protein
VQATKRAPPQPVAEAVEAGTDNLATVFKYGPSSKRLSVRWCLHSFRSGRYSDEPRQSVSKRLKFLLDLLVSQRRRGSLDRMLHAPPVAIRPWSVRSEQELQQAIAPRFGPPPGLDLKLVARILQRIRPRRRELLVGSAMSVSRAPRNTCRFSGVAHCTGVAQGLDEPCVPSRVRCPICSARRHHQPRCYAAHQEPSGVDGTVSIMSVLILSSVSMATVATIVVGAITAVGTVALASTPSPRTPPRQRRAA